MANRKKKQSREEILEKKRIAERERKKNIMNDPERAENLRRKERERYHRKKAEGKILPLSSMQPRDRRRIQKRNRVNYRAYYKRQKEKFRNVMMTKSKVLQSTTATPIPLLKPSHDIDSSPPQSPRLSRSRSVTADPDTSISRQLRSRTVHTFNRNVSSPTPGMSTTNQHPVRTPSVSSIHSPTPSVQSYPDSPSSNTSINSEIYQIELKKKFRKYQRTKAAQMYSLRERLVALTKEKESYRKRAERMQNILHAKNTPKMTSTPVKKTDTANKSSQMPHKQKQLRSTVVKFYEDDENSRICPGKRDCITKNGLKKQKRYMTDSIKNLHKSYLKSGYPPISYITFGRLKPFWVVKPDLNTRDTCICQIHANMDLKVTALKNKKIINESTSSDILKSLCCDEITVDCLQRKCLNCKNKIINYNEFDNSETMAYWTWGKKTNRYIKDNVEKKANIVEKVRCYAKPIVVIKQFEQSLIPFMKHCGNIKNQYNAIKTIKQNISEKECLIHIDFSENFNTKYHAEVQAVHFGGSRSQITLHTSMIYYPSRDQNLETQAYCTISKCLRHDATAVWAHLVPVLQELEKLSPSIETLHVVSDSPSAQYRNKKIFYIMSQLHCYCSNLSRVIWHYCECGHGKGAPDGVGGVLKRTADQLVAYGHDIPDLDTFMRKLQTSVTGVKMQVVEDYEVKEKDWLLPNNLKTFSGTMKVHQAIWKKGVNIVALRSLSCTELECLYNPVQCYHDKHLGYFVVVDGFNTTSQELQPPSRSNPSIVHRFKGSDTTFQELQPPSRSNPSTVHRFKGSDTTFQELQPPSRSNPSIVHRFKGSDTTFQELQPLSRSNPSTVHRFKGSENFVLRSTKITPAKKQPTLQNISLDISLSEDLNINNDINPDTFFDNIGDSTFAKYENATDLNENQRSPDKTQDQKNNNKVNNSDSDSDDYNIF